MKAEPFGNEIMVTNAFILVRNSKYKHKCVCVYFEVQVFEGESLTFWFFLVGADFSSVFIEG